MAQITLVLVDISSQEVLDLRPQDSASGAPYATVGTMWLKPGIDFPAITVVAMGMIWDGTRDPVQTKFAVAPPPAGDLTGLTVAEKQDELDATLARAAEISAAIKQDLGG